MSAFTPDMVEAPIRDMVMGLNELPHCFTLQCCYGHFLCAGQSDESGLEPLPVEGEGPVAYRIAYVALCIEAGDKGANLRDRLAEVCEVDAEYVQFGSPGWFWRRHVNSYALQVEPARYVEQDQAELDYTEALHVQAVRDEFYRRLREIVAGARAGNG